MKKLVYRDMIGNNPRKHEVSIEEVNHRREADVSKKWMCKYFVKESYTSTEVESLKRWIRMKKEKGLHTDCHILRHLDTRHGWNKVICKVLGEFFIVNRQTAYRIVYINEVKIEISSAKKGEGSLYEH